MTVRLPMSGFLLRRPVGDARLLGVLGVGVVTTFLGLFFSAQAGLLFLAGAWLAVGTWKAPWGAFLLLLSVAPFLLILKSTGVLGELTVLKDVVILALFLRTLRMGGPRIPHSLLVPVCFLVGWVLVAFVRSDALSLGLLRLRDILLYLLVLPVAARLLYSRERLRALLLVLSSTAALVLLLGVAQWAFFRDGMVLRFDPQRQVWIPRLASVLAHPNNLGGYLLFPLPVGALAAMGIPSAQIRVRTAASLLTLGMLVAVYFTYSRSAWIAHGSAIGVLLLVTTWSWKPRLLRYGIVGVFLIAGVAIAVPQVRSLLLSVFDPAYASNRERLDFFVGILAQASLHGAVGGEGLGDTLTLLGRSADITLFEILAAEAGNVQRAKARTFLDNGALKLWVEEGVVGVVLVLWVAARVLQLAVTAARQALTREGRAVGVVMLAILAGLLPLWFFLDVPDMFPVNLLFWTFAGAVVASCSVNTGGARTGHEAPVR